MSLGRILVVEDEALVAQDLIATLTDIGYSVVGEAASAEEAVQKAAELVPDVVLMDIRLSGNTDGVQATAAIRRKRDIPVIYLTAHSDEETLRRAKTTAPCGYLVKPFRTPDLRCAIEIALHKHEIEVRLREREKWLATTLRSIGDGVVATNSQGRVVFLNPVAEALTGWNRDDALGRGLDDIVKLVAEGAPRSAIVNLDETVPGHFIDVDVHMPAMLSVGIRGSRRMTHTEDWCSVPVLRL